MCKQPVNRNMKNGILCGQCKCLFHGKCVGLGETEIDEFKNRTWSCSECIAKLRFQRSNSDSTPVKVNQSSNSTGSFIDLETFNKSIDELKLLISTGNKSLREDLTETIRDCSAKIDRACETLAKQADLIKKQQSSIERLTEENMELRKRVEDVTNQMDDLEQYSRRNTVEIYGVPSEPEEDVAEIVVNVCKSVGVDVSKNSIDACHRLRKRENRPTAGIAVRFVRRDDVEDLIQGRKTMGDLNTQHIGFAGEPKPVYVNRSLTARRRLLFAKAKKVQREKGFKFVWTDMNGNVRMKFKEGDKVIKIYSEKDLQDIMDE